MSAGEITIKVEMSDELRDAFAAVNKRLDSIEAAIAVDDIALIRSRASMLTALGAASSKVSPDVIKAAADKQAADERARARAAEDRPKAAAEIFPQARCVRCGRPGSYGMCNSC